MNKSKSLVPNIETHQNFDRILSLYQSLGYDKRNIRL